MRHQKLDDPNLYDCLLWDLPVTSSPEERLAAAMENACRRHRSTHSLSFRAAFYRYTSLKSTIRIENGITLIRISDILKDAPQHVLEALIHILISRTTRRKPHPDHVYTYEEYIQRPEIESKHAAARTTRCRKVLPGTAGNMYDLNDSFDRINHRYFNGELPKPELSWSPKPSRRRLGYHDGHLNLIVISRWLDRKTVPEYILDYIMYHELLHMTVPAKVHNGRRQVHSREFKRLERRFERYHDALCWLRK